MATLLGRIIRTKSTLWKHLPKQFTPYRVTMKNNSLKHKFRNINIVKPLYKKVTRAKPKIRSVNIDNPKLYGDGFWVKRKVFHDKSVDFDLTSIKHRNSGYRFLPGACEVFNSNKTNINMHDDEVFSITNNRLGKPVPNVIESNNEVQENKLDKSVQANSKFVFPQKIPACWLKVWPAPEAPDDSFCSIVFRCFVCQLGMASFLVLWTVLWVFIINSYEEPHEYKVSKEFEKQQNQLVIDLATELRQITPLSPKWKESIERRIGDERRLTMQAVGRGGAIFYPGHYWNHAGTFLFTVYVMTALGFGAPVPQTLWGRSAALLYAVLAVPTHIYLMVNLSTCIVSKVDRYIKAQRKMKIDLIQEKPVTDKNAGSPTCSRNSDVMKARKSFSDKMIHSFRFLCFGRGVPLAAVLYYSVGAVTFGVLRGKRGLDVALFPLEFTTNGGLEHVEEHVRFLYGFYVEGAMTLLACMVATIRLHSTAAAYSVADHYKLFNYDIIDV